MSADTRESRPVGRAAQETSLDGDDSTSFVNDFTSSEDDWDIEDSSIPDIAEPTAIDLCGVGDQFVPSRVTAGFESVAGYEWVSQLHWTPPTKAQQAQMRDEAPIAKAEGENLRMIVRNDPILRHLGRNMMGDRLEWMSPPPWRVGNDAFKDATPSFTDKDMPNTLAVVRGYFGGLLDHPKEQAISDMLRTIGDEKSYHPFRTHVESLPAWDGVDRLGTAIPEVEPTEYTRKVFTSWFLGMMDRVYHPGCQMDNVLVLIGTQGHRKTSWFRAIVPDARLLKTLSTVPDSSREKDLLAQCHEAQIVLFDEIDQLNRKADQSRLKEFVTGVNDSWRAPYERSSQSRSRGFVIGGTTNVESFLVDTNGNRRYWPVVIDQRISGEHLSREYMDRLLAEARDRYRAGERLDYSSEFEALAETARTGHVDDPVRDAIAAYMSDALVEHQRRIDLALMPAGTYPPELAVLNVPVLIERVAGLDWVKGSAMSQGTRKITDAMAAMAGYRRLDERRRVAGRQGRCLWVHESVVDLDAALAAAEPVSPEVADFWAEFRGVFQWHFLPSEFVHDLFAAWFRARTPGKNPLDLTTFWSQLTVLASQPGSGWTVTGRSRPGTRMDASEPLIQQYGLKAWTSTGYQGSNTDWICKPTLREFYPQGLAR